MTSANTASTFPWVEAPSSDEETVIPRMRSDPPLEVVPDLDTAERDEHDAAWDFIREVEHRKFRLRVDREARAQLAGENAPPIPESFNAADFLAQPEVNPVYRVDGLWPYGGKIMLAAQYKAGKTTATHNLIRCLADGDPFLGRFGVETPEGRVFLIDAELAPDTARRWLRAQGIRNPSRVEYQNIKGAASSFNPLDEQCRAQWAGRLKAAGATILVVDCLSPVLTACGMEENSPTDVRRFLNALDQLVADALISECVVVHHMGHFGERTRGASSLLDWPDATISLVRQDEDPASPRFMSAFGRDVDVRECALAFDDATKHLTISGGSRKDASVDAALAEVVQLLASKGEMSGNAIEKDLADVATQKDIREAIKRANGKELAWRAGPRNAKLWSLKNPSSSVRQSSLPVRQRGGVEFVSSSIGDELNSTHDEDPGTPSRNELNGHQTTPCTVCNEPLDPALVDAGLTTHGEE